MITGLIALGWLRKAGGRPNCLGLSKCGAPRHPLYVARSEPLVPFLVETCQS